VPQLQPFKGSVLDVFVGCAAEGAQKPPDFVPEFLDGSGGISQIRQNERGRQLTPGQKGLVAERLATLKVGAPKGNQNADKTIDQGN
jgi:hypothetical protein